MSVVNVVSRSSNSCTYCGKDYHTKDNYFKKNGYPPNFFSNWGGKRGRGSGRGRFGDKSNNNDKVCTHCRINEHTIDECYMKHGYPLDTSCTKFKIVQSIML